MVFYVLLVGVKIYNELKIKKQLGKKVDARLFSVIKNRLFHLILDTLGSYYTDDLPDFTIQQIIKKAKILLAKKLTDQAWKHVWKAQQAALKNEFFPEAIQALEIERKIIEFQDKEVYEKLMKDNLAQVKSCVEKYNNLMEYVHLQTKMFAKYTTNIVVRNKQDIAFLKKMLKHPLLKGESSALSFRANYFFYLIKAICYRYLGDMEKSYENSQKRIAMFESVPMVSSQMKRYINALHQMAGIQNSLGKFADSLQSIRKIRDIAKLHPQFAKSIPPEMPFTYSVITETDLYLRISDYKTGVAQIPRIEAELKKFKHTLHKHLQYILYYNITLLCFGTENYHKALNWLNKILNENKDDYALDLICASKILFLIIHIELGNDDLLEYAAQSTHRYLTTRKRKYKVESIFLDLLNIILNPSRKKEMITLLGEILVQFKQLKSDPYEQGAFELFDYISWIESKIENRPFADIVKDKAGRA